jgi:hypothetical protein
MKTHQRLSALSNHFLQASSWNDGQTTEHKNGKFSDSWSYLDMNQFLTKEGIKLKLDVSSFMAKINPTLYEYTETANFPHHLI